MEVERVENRETVRNEKDIFHFKGFRARFVFYSALQNIMRAISTSRQTRNVHLCGERLNVWGQRGSSKHVDMFTTGKTFFCDWSCCCCSPRWEQICLWEWENSIFIKPRGRETTRKFCRRFTVHRFDEKIIIGWKMLWWRWKMWQWRRKASQSQICQTFNAVKTSSFRLGEEMCVLPSNWRLSSFRKLSISFEFLISELRTKFVRLTAPIKTD